MKIISNEEYKRLTNLQDSEKEVARLNRVYDELKEEKSKMYTQYIKDKENTEKDHNILLARAELEYGNKILEATKDLINKNQELLLNNGNLKKEVEILTKAFENLGFDVKDMKSILDKLVDGIVGKNVVQLIK